MDKQFEEILKEVHVYGEPITKDKINSPDMIDLIIERQNLEIRHIVKNM